MGCFKLHHFLHLWVALLLRRCFGFCLFKWIHFSLCWVFIAGQRLPLVAVCGLITAGASVEERRLSALALSCSCGSWLLELAGQELWSQAQLPCSMWNLPGPGIQTRVGGFLPTAPTRKSSPFIFKFCFCLCLYGLVTFYFAQWVISHWCSPQGSGETDLHYPGWPPALHAYLPCSAPPNGLLNWISQEGKENICYWQQ